MLAVDVNVLIHANRSEMALHDIARERLRHLAEGDTHWGLPTPVVWGFLRIVTQPVFDPPTAMSQAVAIVAICRERAVSTVLSTDRDFARFDQVTWEQLADST